MLMIQGQMLQMKVKQQQMEGEQDQMEPVATHIRIKRLVWLDLQSLLTRQGLYLSVTLYMLVCPFSDTALNYHGTMLNNSHEMLPGKCCEALHGSEERRVCRLSFERNWLTEHNWKDWCLSQKSQKVRFYQLHPESVAHEKEKHPET